MNIKPMFLLSLALGALFCNKSTAQGCSDAGFCTIGLLGGIPFVVRDVRPDGLTRKFVLSPELSFNF